MSKPPTVTLLRALMLERGLTYVELASLTDISPRQVFVISQGLQSPSVHRALRIAEALGASVEEIWGSSNTEVTG